MYKDKFNKYSVKLHNLIGGAGALPEPAPEPVPEPAVVQAPRQRSAIFSEGPNPPLFVFDCDFTIWPFDCDGPALTDPQPPYTRGAHGYVYGVNPIYNYPPIHADPYPNVPYILGALYDAGIQVAFASRNRSADQIEALLRLIPLQSQQPGLSLWDSLRGRRDLFHAYSSGSNGGENNKLRHFTRLRNASSVGFPNMVFFDDNRHNTNHAESIGIISILLSQASGLTWDAIDNVVGRWRARQAAPAPAPAAAP